MHDIDAVGRPLAFLMIYLGATWGACWLVCHRLRVVAYRAGYRAGERSRDLTGGTP